MTSEPGSVTINYITTLRWSLSLSLSLLSQSNVRISQEKQAGRLSKLVSYSEMWYKKISRSAYSSWRHQPMSTTTERLLHDQYHVMTQNFTICSCEWSRRSTAKCLFPLSVERKICSRGWSTATAIRERERDGRALLWSRFRSFIIMLTCMMKESKRTKQTSTSWWTCCHRPASSIVNPSTCLYVSTCS